jgi:Flp pilus assembly protein TadB
MNVFSILAVLVFIAVFVTLVVLTRRGPASSSVKVGSIEDDVWTAARESVAGTALGPLVSVGRPFSKVPMVWDEDSTFSKYVQQRLLAAGGVFGGSVQVYLSVQLGCLLIAGVFLLLGFVGILPLLISGPMALIVGILPFAQVDSLARRRKAEVTAALPEFAELLLMPLNSGLAVLPSLEFCADRTQGPVAGAVRNMLSLIRSRAMNESEAFTYTGERLGTPEARSFFNALLAAQLEGVKVVDNVRAQADSLRVQLYQHRRAEAKKLPVKLILIFGVHMLPMLFIIGLIPAFIALSQI